MEWIKRNLYFVIGSAIALVLLGGAGWYFFSKVQLNNQILEKLNNEYSELSKLAQKKPHPGNEKVDNIEEAKKQQQEVRAFMRQTFKYFQRIPPIPDLPKL